MKGILHSLYVEPSETTNVVLVLTGKPHYLLSDL